MSRATFGWMLYVTAYAAGLGLPLLVAPNVLLPFLGFETTREPWVRLAAALLLALAFITFTIYRKRVAEMIVPTVFVRLGLAAVLVGLGLAGYPPFLFVMAGIVLIGVVGTLLSLRSTARKAEARFE
jgi:hypothetical membrane protein